DGFGQWAPASRPTGAVAPGPAAGGACRKWASEGRQGPGSRPDTVAAHSRPTAHNAPLTTDRRRHLHPRTTHDRPSTPSAPTHHSRQTVGATFTGSPLTTHSSP